MSTFDHNTDPAWLQPVLNRLGDLRGHPFLDLEAPRETIDHADKLGDADDPSRGQVADMSNPGDRRHVMFTARAEGNIPQQDWSVEAADLLKSAQQVFGRILVISGKPFIIGAQN